MELEKVGGGRIVKGVNLKVAFFLISSGCIN